MQGSNYSHLVRKITGELSLIEVIRSRAIKLPRSAALLRGIGDDCALLRPSPGEDIAVTTDFSLENVHFRRDWHPPESVGHRCLARGLSDLAAMGAAPIAAFLSLALPSDLPASWVRRFINGMFALAGQAGVSLAGGDTAQAPGSRNSPGLISADIVLVGGVKRGKALLRSGAHPGDIIYVTGNPGGAAAELLALERDPRRFSNLKRASDGHPHLYPSPRLGVGQRLAARSLASAAIDLSDGLSTDLSHICQESGLSAEIETGAIPIHPMAALAEAAGWTSSALDLALHGGEDYELLFTGPAGTKMPARIDCIPVRAIGKMKRRTRGRPRIQLRSRDGKTIELKPGGWEHFRR